MKAGAQALKDSIGRGLGNIQDEYITHNYMCVMHIREQGLAFICCKIKVKE